MCIRDSFTCIKTYNVIHVLINTQSTTKACDPAGEHQGKYCRRRVYLRDVGKCAQMSNIYMSNICTCVAYVQR